MRSLDRARELLGRTAPTRLSPCSAPPTYPMWSRCSPAGVCTTSAARARRRVLDVETPRIAQHALRTRARYGVRRALAHAAAGEVDHACAVAGAVLPSSGSYTPLRPWRISVGCPTRSAAAAASVRACAELAAALARATGFLEGQPCTRSSSTTGPRAARRSPHGCDDRLSARFSPTASSSPGIRSTLGHLCEVLVRAPRRSRVLLALIDEEWVDAPDRYQPGRRALDNPKDWVRREIEGALSSGALIVPLLIGRHVEQLDPIACPPRSPNSPSASTYASTCTP